jgi:hypothetical protein
MKSYLLTYLSTNKEADPRRAVYQERNTCGKGSNFLLNAIKLSHDHLLWDQSAICCSKKKQQQKN